MMERFPRLGERCERVTLENGLTIYVVPKPGYFKKFAFFATGYGGMDTRYQLDGQWMDTPEGVAHYLEHKMFDLPEGNALQMLTANGASPNAFTAADITGYYFECNEQFEENLRLLLRFVTTPYFTEESVTKEQGIIGQEIQMMEDNPDWVQYQNLLKGLYQNASVRISVAGTQASIAEITPDVLAQCHRAFYRPSNMVLCVAGDVKPERVLAIARELLPKERGEIAQKDHGAAEPEQANQSRTEVFMPVSAPNCLIGFKAPPHEMGETGLRQLLLGNLAAELLAGDAGALYNRLYQEGRINKTFSGGYDSYPGAAMFFFGGETKNPDALLAALLEEGERIRQHGLEEERFQRCKKAYYGLYVRALNSEETCCIQLARSHFKGYHYYGFPELFDSITRQNVEAFLSQCIRPERAALSIVSPNP